MDPGPPSPEQMTPEQRRAALLAAETALLAARRAWQQDPSPENTAAYEAALEHAMRFFDPPGT